MKKAIFFYSLKVLTPTVLGALLWWSSGEPFARSGGLAGALFVVSVITILVAGSNYKDDLGDHVLSLHQRIYNADFELSSLRRSNGELRSALATQEENVKELNKELRLWTRELDDARVILRATETQLNSANETIKELEQKS